MVDKLYAWLTAVCMMFVPMLSFGQLSADFHANTTTGCAPMVIQFTDASTGNPVQWHWDLGNGTIATQQHPSTTYILPGAYTVSLTVYDGQGNSHTTTRTNYINVTPSPQVSFFASDSQNICPPATIRFTNQTVAGAPGPVSYSWDFGDGNSSNLPNPDYTYTNPGNYMVTLVATNSNGCPGSLIRQIQIVNRPQAGFSASNNIGCTAPLTVNFTNTSANATSYTWLFGDGGSSTSPGPNLTHTYAAPGVYSVTLIARNPSGCADTLVRTNLVSIGSPVASFNLSNSTICAGTSVSFTNTSSGASSYQWDFGSGAPSNAANPPVRTYPTDGTYTIRLIAIQGNCRDTFTRQLTVLPRPVVDFTVDSAAGCKIPHTVRFTNASTGAGSYLWNFGDGDTSTQENPVHTYMAAGNRTVTLTAIGVNGCSTILSRSNYIRVATLTPSITVLPTGGGCTGDTMRFTGAVSTPPYPISSYNWTFGDGGTGTGANAWHVYNAPGIYPVTLTIHTVNGCIFTQTTNVNISVKPDASFTASPLNVCIDEEVTFTNTSTGATSYRWIFGDGNAANVPNSNPVRHRYHDTGYFTVQLVAINNFCRDTLTQANLIHVTGPAALFTPVYSCTDRLSISFINNSQRAVTYDWDFGDGNTSTLPLPTHTYASSGPYTIRLIVTDVNGCIDTATANITLYDPPAVGFTADDTVICKGETVSFTRLSNSPGYTYVWSFGGGGASNSPNTTVTHRYTVAGTYDVRLIVTDGRGCRDTMIRENYIRVGGPVPQFAASPSPATGCTPLTVNFTDQSTTPGSTMASRVWHFGDGAVLTGNDPAPSHTYHSNTARNYTVKLVVTDVNGCSDSATGTSMVSISRPTANFNNPAQACKNQPVTFTNTSSGAVSYIWDFGDGGSDTQQHPVHTYTTAGTYSVQLIAVNSNGCRDTLLKNNTIRIDEVIAAFTVSDSVADCPPLVVQFANTSSGAGSYTWDFGNGISSTVTNPSSVYTLPGVYPVVLTATGNGCTDTATKNITIHGPSAQGGFDYTPLSGCVPFTVTFTAVAINTQTYSWDMNNGSTHSTSTGSFTYTYTQPGAYVPVLVLSNSANCNVAVIGTDTIHVDQIEGDFSFTASSFCVDNPVQFRDTVYRSGSQQITRHWDFGDGNNSTQQHPVHTYTTAGTYNVRLVFTNGNGCADTITHMVTIHDLPNVAATATPPAICPGETIQLQATGADTFSWSPATDLSCSTCPAPVATPLSPVTYVVRGTDIHGCTDTAVINISPGIKPVLSLIPDTTVCYGTDVTLTASGADTYSWSPATGLSCTNCPAPVVTAATTTTYTVIGASADGCTDTATVTVTVNQLPVLTVTPSQTICTGSSLQLLAGGAGSYNWTPSTGLSCTACPDPMATPTATTTYVVTGTDANNCSDTAQVTVSVLSNPVVSVADQDLCMGDSVMLQATGAAAYEWSPSAGLSCTNCDNPTASPTTTTVYTVVGTIAGGCSDTTQVTVTVHDLPVVSAGPDQEICIGTSATLQATGAVNYSWSPGVGLSCTNCDNPTATPTMSTTYTVVGVDGNSCRDTASVTVSLLPLPVIVTTPDDDICMGDSISLTVSGADSYVWSPAAGLSCTSCPDPVASPGVTTTYTVVGTDTNGCVDSAGVTVNVISRPVIVVADADVCLGDSVQLQASGAPSFQWSPATGLSCTTCPDPMVSPAVTTTYTVRGTLTSGCSDSAQVTVTVHDLPVVSAGPDQEICVGGSATLQATGAASYSWSPGTGLSCVNCDNPAASPPDTTTYVVTGTDAMGCINYDTVIVDVKPLPSISAGGNRMVCRGDTVHLSASGGISYTWDATADLSCLSCPDPVATPVTPATYRVTGAGANGCTDTASVTVGFHPQPVLSGGGNRDLCIGDTLQLQASGGMNYIWSPASGLSCTTCADPDAWPAITTTYTLKGASINGCVDSVDVTVTVHPIPDVSAGPDREICLGDNVTLNASGAATYTWTPASGLSCSNCPSPVASPAATTVYTVVGSSQAGCRDTAEVTVLVNPLPQVTTSTDPLICRGDTARLQASGALSYAWSPSPGLSCTNCADPVASPSQPTTYTVIGTDTNGCSDTSQVRVLFFPDPVISAGPDQTICRGEFAQLQASGGVSYTWSPAAGLTCTDCPDPVAAPSADMRYYLSGTDANGCTGRDSVYIAVVQPAETAVGDDTRICAGQSVQLSATGGVGYTWSPAEGLSCTDCPEPVARPDTSTRYQVVITHNHCFADTLYQSVAVLPVPTVNLGADQHIFAGEQVRLFANSTHAAYYAWSPTEWLSCTDCISPVAIPERTITYQVKAYNELGCSATDDIRITLKCDGSMLFVPNTFTPNGDGQNDRFFPHANGIRMVDMFRVYSRWGEMVFERQQMPVNDPVHGWDGTFKGQVLSPDTYVYILQATCINGEQVTLKGDVSLVR